MLMMDTSVQYYLDHTRSASMLLSLLSGNPSEPNLENLPFGDQQRRDIQTWLDISSGGAREDSDS
jgi:hypothetical protein